MKRKLLIWSGAILTLLLAVLILLPVLVMSLFLNERQYQPQYSSSTFGIESERITLTTGDDLDLAAWRTFAYTEPRGTVIILSGLQMPSVTAFFGYANMFAQNGWDSLLIEKRARSLSQGESIGFGITEWRDVQAGVDFLVADGRAGDKPIVAMGTSAGGATVIIAAGQIPRIDGVIALSAYSNFTDLYVDSMSAFGLPRVLGTMSLPFMHLRMGMHFGFGALSYTPLEGIARLDRRPILLMHSSDDWQVPFSHFHRLYDAAVEAGVNVSTFVREGDWHFVCYDRYVYTPWRDVEFAGVVIGFLEGLAEG